MTAFRKVRLLIAENDRLARETIRHLLDSEAGFDVVAETDDGIEAVALTRRHRPDAVLLDVELRGIDGFEVMASFEPESPPAVIILTAQRHHAVRAFEAGAIDYLLKPISGERLRSALLRVRALAESPARSLHQLHELQNAVPARIAVRQGAASVVIPILEILCVESAGTHCRITTKLETFVVHESLTRLHQRLPVLQFARISRFAIVNLSEVAGFQPKSNGDQQLCLSNGAKLVLSRTRRIEVMARLKHSP